MTAIMDKYTKSSFPYFKGDFTVSSIININTLLF